MALLSHISDFFRNRESRAVAVPFYLFGLLFGSWATMIPLIKEKFFLSDSQLGLLLLCLPTGALIFNSTSARLIQRYGMQNMTIIGMFVLIVLSFTWLTIPSLIGLVIALIITGMTNTQLNIAMNLCANSLEHNKMITILATCHGMFSLGLMSGALLTSTSLGLGLSPDTHLYFNGILATLFAVSAVATIKQINNIDSYSTKKKEPKFKLKFPKGALLVMVGISLCTNLTEGSMVDWTSVYMREVVEAKLIYVGWALAAFSIAMVIGRLLGDKMIPILGSSNILIYGGLLCFVGLLMVIFWPNIYIVLPGFFMAGLGLSCAAPILYGAAARVKGLPQGEGMGLAVLNSFSIFGFLVGPVILGFISDLTDLRYSFVFIILLTLIWIVLARRVDLDQDRKNVTQSV